MHSENGHKTNTIQRHCMVVHAYYPLGETRVEREAKALLRRGIAVDVIALRGDGEAAEEVVDGITVHRLPVQRHKGRGSAVQFVEYLAFVVLVFAKLARLHGRSPYHVVQIHNIPDFLVFAALAPKLRGARIILDIHDLMPEFYASRFDTPLDSRPVRLVIWQEQLSCRFADHVITVSEHWRETLIRRGVDPAKISVVMNVADDEIFHTPAALSLPHEPSALRLIYHGTIVDRYGLDLAVEAVAQLREIIPGIHLTIVGQGEHVTELERLIAELELDRHVSLRNTLLPAEELPALILSADLGIVPYRNDPFTDGLLPTKLMEYAALGLPAVAARTTAIERYFAGTNTELFEPGNANDLAAHIAGLYRSPERLRELQAGSGRFTERYNWPVIGSAYADLVMKLGRNGS